MPEMGEAKQQQGGGVVVDHCRNLRKTCRNGRGEATAGWRRSCRSLSQSEKNMPEMGEAKQQQGGGVVVDHCRNLRKTCRKWERRSNSRVAA